VTTPRGPRVDRTFAAAVATRTPTPLTHDLTDHPLLSADAIAVLAGELPVASISAEAAEKPLVGAAPSFQRLASATIVERIRALAENESWFTLLNIEQTAAYRALVDEIVDAVAERSGLPRRSLRRRMGFVFASSPGSVTPAHFDIEHSLLMQLMGRRRLCFGRFSTPAAREREVQRYWAGSFGRLETMPEPMAEHDLEPGAGAYIPPYTPHWLSNGDRPSLSLTVTFFDRSNEDESQVQVLNERLRRWGMDPAPYGSAPRRDLAKAAVMRGYAAVQRWTGRERSSGSR
jgi:hypothetical protein